MCVTLISAGTESSSLCKSPGAQSPGLFYISNPPQIPVGAGLPAKTASNSTSSGQILRFREQARSHRVLACLWEIVENNIPKLVKRDIKPLQIVVLSRF
jgi:hypothetical protein